MFENKYGKFLTIILIIVVVIIVGLLGFLIVDLIMTSNNDSAAAYEADRFINDVADNTEEPENVQNEVGNVEVPIIGDEGNPTHSGSSGGSSHKYEGFTEIGVIEIPKTGIKYPILNEVTPKSIQKAVAVLYPLNLQLLNQPGNVTIVGHNYRNSSFFSNNKNLAIGDKIYITDITGNRVEYTIDNKYTTTAEDADYMMRDTGGKRTISLSTCTSDVSKRLVIWASAD